MKPIVQISLDLTNIDEALETAAMAMRAGIPRVPIVANLSSSL